MYQTHICPVRDLRNKYSEISKMLKDRDQVVITNQGRGEAVLLGIDEFEEYEKFKYQRYIKEKLDEARKQAADPNAKWLSMDEFFDEIDKLI